MKVSLEKLYLEKLYFTQSVLEKLYFTLEKLYFTLKRLFAFESSSQLAFRLLLYRSLRVHQAIAPGDLDRKDPLHFPASAQQHSFH